MSVHLSPQQIDDWVIGERSREAAEHLRACGICAGEVERIAGPLRLFGSAVRDLGEQVMPVREWMPAGNGWTGMWQLRLAVVMAAIVLMIGVPVYRHLEIERQAAITAAQDEILLRQVEVGLSRSVPAPMEPLATLMSSDLNR